MRIHHLLLLLTALCLFVQCNSSKNAGTDSNLPKGAQYVYYRGEPVGYVYFEEEVLSFSKDDNVNRQLVTEEITYSGSRYRFQYLKQEGIIIGLTIKKYSRDESYFQPGDSYALRLDIDGIHRTFFKADGETIRDEVVIQEPRMIANAQDAFFFIERFWRDYYAPFFRGVRLKPRQKQLPSLGHELFRYDKI